MCAFVCACALAVCCKLYFKGFGLICTIFGTCICLVRGCTSVRDLQYWRKNVFEILCLSVLTGWLHCCYACVLVMWCPAVCFHLLRTFHEGLNPVVRCFGLTAYLETMNLPLPPPPPPMSLVRACTCTHMHTHTYTHTHTQTHKWMQAHSKIRFHIFYVAMFGEGGSIQLQIFTSLKVTIKNITFSRS